MTNELNLAQLILNAKGDRSYERLSRDCGGTPTDKRLQQMATSKLKAFPDGESLQGIAVGTGVTLTAVVLAAARSLGLAVHDGADPNALVIGNGASLSAQQQEAIRSLVASFLHGNRLHEITLRAAKGEATMEIIQRLRVSGSESPETIQALTEILREQNEALRQDAENVVGVSRERVAQEREVQDRREAFLLKLEGLAQSHGTAAAIDREDLTGPSDRFRYPRLEGTPSTETEQPSAPSPRAGRRRGSRAAGSANTPPKKKSS